jgi:hypothetical protein
MAPRLILLMSSGSKKKEPRYTCLCAAKASHSHRMWAEVSSSAPHLLHSGLSDSPVRWRRLFRILCPVRRPVTALDCVLFKDRNLALAPRQGPEISSRACLWVSPRPRHHTQCWLIDQGLILLRTRYPVYRLPRPAQVQQTLEQSRPLRARRRCHFLILLEYETGLAAWLKMSWKGQLPTTYLRMKDTQDHGFEIT